ncbi:uncharacterized protein [Tenebrio molitor]|jgi:hypothetical protein|uniref:uncharacterized protein isoform X1 n=1 Tax=Tenebrio molitor TaxID=7067 RepID=UPI001C398BFC|nr:unnamed protein product [Tenebrio molitor]
MDKCVPALSEHEVFIREFITLYKQQPVLWRQKHPQYRNRTERSEAYEVLVRKCQEYYSEADEDFVKMKIDSMRSTFRKERKKVLNSKENSTNPEDVYKPSLWYYDLLLFTAGEEAEGETSDGTKTEDSLAVANNPEEGNYVKIPFWSREHSAILINFYKNHPCLYSTSHPEYKNKRKRNEAVKKVTERLMATTGKYFHAEDVRRKISLIRGQFLYEYKKIKKSESLGEVYTPTLWCFEMLSFLKEEYSSKKRIGSKASQNQANLRRKNRRKNSTSESDDDLDIKKESDSSLSSESVHLQLDVKQTDEEDDIFDTIAKNLAHQMREMSEQQRNIANKIVRDVMYHGQMEHLTVKSRLSLDGV